MDIQTAKHIYNMLNAKPYLNEEEQALFNEAETILSKANLISKEGEIIEEDWPEFEDIKDSVVDFMSDLPIELYEHLYKTVQNNPNALIDYLMKFRENPENK